MKKIKLSKKLIITIISLCFIVVIAGIITSTIIDKKNNPYGVKVRKLPTNSNGFQITNSTSRVYSSKTELNNIIFGTYRTEIGLDQYEDRFDNDNDEYHNEYNNHYDDLYESRFFSKYDDEFFEDNVLYYATSPAEYDGFVRNSPHIDIKKCYYSDEDERIIIEVNVTTEIGYVRHTVDEDAPVDIHAETPEYDPRGYVIEFPRKMFDDNNLDYDRNNFRFNYLNVEDEKFFYQYK